MRLQWELASASMGFNDCFGAACRTAWGRQQSLVIRMAPNAPAAEKVVARFALVGASYANVGNGGAMVL